MCALAARPPVRSVGADGGAGFAPCDAGHETVSPLRDRLDDPRFLGIVVEKLPQVRDRSAQDRLRDEPAAPHVVEDLVLRHDLVRVLRQIDEEIHEPGPQVAHFARPADPVQARLDEPAADTKRLARERRIHGWRL